MSKEEVTEVIGEAKWVQGDGGVTIEVHRRDASFLDDGRWVSAQIRASVSHFGCALKVELPHLSPDGARWLITVLQKYLDECPPNNRARSDGFKGK